eukprot:949471-Prymnesium_polylepis.2
MRALPPRALGAWGRVRTDFGRLLRVVLARVIRIRVLVFAFGGASFALRVQHVRGARRGRRDNTLGGRETEKSPAAQPQGTLQQERRFFYSLLFFVCQRQIEHAINLQFSL